MPTGVAVSFHIKVRRGSSGGLARWQAQALDLGCVAWAIGARRPPRRSCWVLRRVDQRQPELWKWGLRWFLHHILSRTASSSPAEFRTGAGSGLCAQPADRPAGGLRGGFLSECRLCARLCASAGAADYSTRDLSAPAHAGCCRCVILFMPPHQQGGSA